MTQAVRLISLTGQQRLDRNARIGRQLRSLRQAGKTQKSTDTGGTMDA